MNATIVGTAYHANTDDILVHNSGTSGSKSPTTWGALTSIIEKYFTSIPYDQQFKPPINKFYSDPKKYEFWYFLRTTIPEKFYEGLSKITFNKGMKKNVDRLKKVNQKGKMVNYLLAHFTTNEWIFDQPILTVMEEWLHPEDRENFKINATTVSIGITF